MNEMIADKIETALFNEMIKFIEASTTMNFVDGLSDEQKFAEIRKMFNSARIKSMESVDYQELFIEATDVK